MKNIDERTTDASIFSYQRMLFRYKYAKRFFNGGTILDIGCGFGYGSQHFDQGKYTGIDYSDQTIEEAKQLYPRAAFHAMEVPPIKLPDESFDNVLCLELIEHVEQKDALDLAREIHRVLKKGGTLFLTTPNVANRGVMPAFHFIEYTTEQIKDILTNAGFTIKHQGGLWLSTYKDRYKENAFSRLRGKLYGAVAGGKKKNTESGEAGQRKNVEVKPPRLNFVKKTIKFLLTILAKTINYMGYVFPKKAEYQAWVAVKQ
jgi:SAM-dependent methyltransferase